MTSSAGSAKYSSLAAPDSITTYQLSAVSISPSSGIGLAEANLTVFRSFFVSRRQSPDLARRETEKIEKLEIEGETKRGRG